MRPARVSKAEADAILASARARGVLLPKPVPVLRAPKRLKRSGPPKRKTALSMYSEKTADRVKGWPEFKRKVFDRDHGRCWWCGRRCPLDVGTVEHIVPRAVSCSDAEALVAWIHHKPYPFSCHGVKSAAGFHGQVIGLTANAKRYGVRGVDLTPTRAPGLPLREFYREIRDTLWRALQGVQRDIDAGRRPSLLA